MAIQQILQVLQDCSELDSVLSELAALGGKQLRADFFLVGVGCMEVAASGSGDRGYLSDRAGSLFPVNPAPIASLLPVGTPTALANPKQLNSDPCWQNGKIPSFQSILGVKFLLPGALLKAEYGAIALARTKKSSWQPASIEALHSLSQQFACALSHARLQEEASALQQYQACSNLFSRSIQRAASTREILPQLLSDLARSLSVARALFLQARPNLLETSDRLQVTVGSASSPSPSPARETDAGAGADANEERSFWLSECPWCYPVAERREPVVISDDSENPVPSASAPSASIFRPDRFPALLLLPVEDRMGDLLGFLALQHDRPRQWSPVEIDFSLGLAAQLGSALAGDRDVTSLRELLRKRTDQLQASLEVQSKLFEQTRKQVKQMQRFNQLKEEFVSTMSHELRTPLTSMALAIRLLRQPGLTPDRQVKYLDILEQQCVQETALIDDLLTMRKLASRQVLGQEMEKADALVLLEPLFYTFRQRWQRKELVLTTAFPEDSLPIETDPDSFRRIFAELLTNAGKYAAPRSEIRFSALCQERSSQHQVLFKIYNVGAGILPDELPHIFEKFRRGEGVTQQAVQGTGLGLSLVKGLVEYLQGSIAATSAPIPDEETLWETCFTVSLPQYTSADL